MSRCPVCKLQIVMADRHSKHRKCSCGYLWPRGTGCAECGESREEMDEIIAQKTLLEVEGLEK